MESDNIDRAVLVSSEIHESTADVTTANNPRRFVKFKWLCSEIYHVLSHITLEPCIFLYFTAYSMEAIYNEIIIDKTCVYQLNFSEAICNNITNNKEEQILVEQVTNRLLMYKKIIECIPSILFALFIGAWSDKHGRKIPLLLPFIGCTLSTLIMLVNTVIWSLQPGYILLSAIPSALTGGLTCLIMSMYAYISDISDKRSRTTRIALLDSSMILGPPLGLLLSKVTKEKIGFIGTEIVIGIIYAINIPYIAFLIKETRGPNARQDLEQELVPKSKTTLRDLFNCENVRQTFKITFMKRANQGRAKIILLMVSICAMVFVFSAISIEYLYVQLKFSWDYNFYVYWNVFTMGVAFLGICFLFPLLSYYLCVRDEVLALSACLCTIASFLLKSFAVHGYEMYIGSVLGMLGIVPIVIARSMASKLVPDNATGKIFSVLGSWESFIPILASPLFTFTYNSTIQFFPGMFYIVEVFFYIIAVVIFTVLFWLNRVQNAGLVMVEEEN